MTVPGNIDALLLGGQRGYKIERSLRFNSADSAYLNRTAGTPTDNKKWTWSAWAKITGTSQALNFASSGGGTSMYFGLETSQGDNFIMQIAGTRVYKSTAIFRDPSAWYHFVFVFDSANGTQADRSILYVNGVRQAATTASVTLNQTTGFNAASTAMNIGYSNAWTATSSDYFSGYLTEIHFIDGQALTPSSFGETDTITGVWKPKKYAGTYGTNGFYLKFADNSGTTSTTLGKDSSGNGNNWTPTNFSVTAGAGNDSLIDTPTPYADGGNGRGNYATWNAVSSSGMSLTNGNLDAVGNVGTASFGNVKATIVPAGKTYWEFTSTSIHATDDLVGLMRTTVNNASGGSNGIGDTGLDTESVAFRTGAGTIRRNGTTLVTYTAMTANQTGMMAYDPATRKLWVGINGTWFNSGDPGAGTGEVVQLTAGYEYIPAFSQTQRTAYSFNFGQRSFSYTPPSGFLALNTQNLPEPSIKKPSSYMDVKLYTGNGGTQTISGLGFSPDLVWIKSRSSGSSSHFWYDAVRGINKRLYSDGTGAETNQSPYGLTAFNSDGFSLNDNTTGDYGVNGSTTYGPSYVAWCWDESATPGFDIVTYTGNGTNRTIAHSLGVAPSMMIVKRRTTAGGDWDVYHSATGATKRLFLNTTAASQTTSVAWNDTAPTSSVFTVGTGADVNQNGDTHVAYLWSEVAGFSKFGSYTGNGSSDGPFVFCGFRPRFILIKQTNAANEWVLIDTTRNTYNAANANLYPNRSNAEDNSITQVDVLSNGFKLREGNAGWQNISGGTYIFAAFAESPQKYSLAR